MPADSKTSHIPGRIKDRFGRELDPTDSLQRTPSHTEPDSENNAS